MVLDETKGDRTAYELITKQDLSNKEALIVAGATALMWGLGFVFGLIVGKSDDEEK